MCERQYGKDLPNNQRRNMIVKRRIYRKTEAVLRLIFHRQGEDTCMCTETATYPLGSMKTYFGLAKTKRTSTKSSLSTLVPMSPGSQRERY